MFDERRREFITLPRLPSRDPNDDEEMEDETRKTIRSRKLCASLTPKTRIAAT
jgi:hypothetical protein